MLALQDWEGAGHAIRFEWLELLGRFSSWALLALFLGLVVRAFLRRRRYRAVDVLSKEDLDALHAEIVAAEKRTVGEIVPVILERSDGHPAAHWLSAVFALLLGSALLGGILPWDRPPLLILAQVALGAVGYLASRFLPDYQRLFIREARAKEMAEEQAFQEFHRHDLHETEARTGVLLFVSLLEHRVVVFADKGINEKLDSGHWVATDRAILDGIRRGSLRDGLIAGIRSAADVLAEHFPWEEGDRNEVPDRVIVRRE